MNKTMQPSMKHPSQERIHAESDRILDTRIVKGKWLPIVDTFRTAVIGNDIASWDLDRLLAQVTSG